MDSLDELWTSLCSTRDFSVLCLKYTYNTYMIKEGDMDKTYKDSFQFLAQNFKKSLYVPT